MRALLMVALAFPLALVGGLAAPLAGAPPTTPLEAASVDAAAPSVASACALATPSARVGAGYVALRWAPCPGATSYTLLRGDSPDALAPLVEVAHAGHVDVAVVAGGVYYYAVGSDGARSPLVVAALPSA